MTKQTKEYQLSTMKSVSKNGNKKSNELQQSEKRLNKFFEDIKPELPKL